MYQNAHKKLESEWLNTIGNNNGSDESFDAQWLMYRIKLRRLNKIAAGGAK
tara:strand:+ start:558 stop:710 length:153 start_codon:yes stop_codon:yes gene_type:complete